MAIPILNELYGEIKRLTAAGSTLACEDFGLKKLSPSLKKLGESAPVFAKLSAKLEDLVGSSDNSEEKLMELMSLVNAVLYTQGDWEAKGETKKLALIENDGTTSLGFRKLRPVIEALTSKGQGRYNVIVEAYNEGLFNKKDKRLILPILKSIEDSYMEIADFVINNIVPCYGETLLPILKRDLDINGGKGDGRRLKAIHRLCKREEMELYKTAADQGSKDVKLSAMEILYYEKIEDEFFENLTKDKKKEVREAAAIILDSRRSGNIEMLYRVFGYDSIYLK